MPSCQYFSKVSAYFLSEQRLIGFVIVIRRRVSVCIIVILLLAFTSLTLVDFMFQISILTLCGAHHIIYPGSHDKHVICSIFWLSFALPTLIVSFRFQLIYHISLIY